MPRGDWIWPGNNQFRRAITSNIIGTTEIESNPLKLGFISFPPSWIHSFLIQLGGDGFELKWKCQWSIYCRWVSCPGPSSHTISWICFLNDWTMNIIGRMDSDVADADGQHLRQLAAFGRDRHGGDSRQQQSDVSREANRQSADGIHAPFRPRFILQYLETDSLRGVSDPCKLNLNGFNPDWWWDPWNVRIRILEEGDFASDFHIFGLQRLPNSIRFYVDGIPIGQVDPPPGGFWDIGNFDKNPGGPNIWANGTSMTPFDYPVSPDPSVSSHCSLSQPRNPAGSSKRSFLSPGILDFSFSFGIFLSVAEEEMCWTVNLLIEAKLFNSVTLS